MLIFSPTIPATQPGRYTCWWLSHMASTWSPTDKGWCLVKTPKIWWEVWVDFSPSHHSSTYSLPLPTRSFTEAEGEEKIKNFYTFKDAMSNFTEKNVALFTISLNIFSSKLNSFKIMYHDGFTIVYVYHDDFTIVSW